MNENQELLAAVRAHLKKYASFKWPPSDNPAFQASVFATFDDKENEFHAAVEKLTDLVERLMNQHR